MLAQHSTRRPEGVSLLMVTVGMARGGRGVFVGKSLPGRLEGVDTSRAGVHTGHMTTTEYTTAHPPIADGDRPLHEIAMDIENHWRNVSSHARVHLNYMHHLHGMGGIYGENNGEQGVLYFLSNAEGWRGEDARRIKKELREMLKKYENSKNR